MNFSLDNILKFPIFETAKTVSGKKELDKKKVEWVSVIESPVENFVRENELVLSTGIGCYKDPDSLFEFVKDVYESGASALAIATGHYIYRIPDDVIEFADERNFVIIDLPWEIRFADIIHEITQSINMLQQKELIRLKEIQQELIEMFLKKQPFSSIIAVVEEELGLPVLVLNHKGSPAGGTANIQDVRRMWLKMKRSEDSYESHHPIFSKLNKAQEKDMQLYHMDILSSEQIQGDFFITAPSSYKMTLKDANIIEQAVMVSALWLSSENAIAENKSILQYDFVLSLTKEEQAPEANLRQKAVKIGFNLDKEYECIIGYPENLETFFYQDESNNNQEQDTWLENMITYIEIELYDAAQSVQREIMYAQEDGKLIIFLEAKGGTSNFSSNGMINEFLDLVDRRLNQLLPGVIVSWGIGRHEEGKMAFYQSYQKASSALELGRQQKGIGKRYHFDNTRISQLILNLSKNREVQEIMKSTLSPLIQYDKKRDMDLIKTFKVYNENFGNVSQAARVLNLHRQSLLYRLRKIESLTNLSLTSQDDLFLLDLSIKVWLSGRADSMNEHAL